MFSGTVYLEDLVSHRAVAEEGHHALDALVGPFLIVVLGTLDGVKETIPVIGNSLQHIMDPIPQKHEEHY